MAEFNLAMFGGESLVKEFEVKAGDFTSDVNVFVECNVSNQSLDLNGFECIVSPENFMLSPNQTKQASVKLTTAPNVKPEKYTITLTAFAIGELKQNTAPTPVSTGTGYRGDSGWHIIQKEEPPLKPVEPEPTPPEPTPPEPTPPEPTPSGPKLGGPNPVETGPIGLFGLTPVSSGVAAGGLAFLAGLAALYFLIGRRKKKKNEKKNENKKKQL